MEEEIEKTDDWRKRFDDEVHWEDGTFGNYAYVKDFAPFIDKEKVRSHNRAIAEAVEAVEKISLETKSKSNELRMGWSHAKAHAINAVKQLTLPEA